MIRVQREIELDAEKKGENVSLHALFLSSLVLDASFSFPLGEEAEPIRRNTSCVGMFRAGRYFANSYSSAEEKKDRETRMKKFVRKMQRGSS